MDARRANKKKHMEVKESSVSIVKNIVKGPGLREDIVDFFSNCGNIARLAVYAVFIALAHTLVCLTKLTRT